MIYFALYVLVFLALLTFIGMSILGAFLKHAPRKAVVDMEVLDLLWQVDVGGRQVDAADSWIKELI